MIANKALDQLASNDIQELITNCVKESRKIEYKKEMYAKSDGDKKEFLKDVSSLANATGGDLVIGVEAKDGVPIAALGLGDFNEDQTRLWCEQILSSGLDPRLQGVQMHAIDGFASGPVFIVRVPRSWSGPHRVKHGGTSRFHSRNSAGTFEMDTRDIRTAIEGTGDVVRRIRDWRDERALSFFLCLPALSRFTLAVSASGPRT